MATIFIFSVTKPKKTTVKTLRFLRNQEVKEEGKPNLCLSDYVASITCKVADYVGLFAVKADITRPARHSQRVMIMTL